MISSLESLMAYQSKESHKSNGITYDLQLTPPMVIGVCKSYIRLSLANSNKPMDTGDITSDGLGRDDLSAAISHLLSAVTRTVQSKTITRGVDEAHPQGGLMKYRFSYEKEPRLTDVDRELFSHGDYDCQRLFRAKEGQVAALLQNRKCACMPWKVVYGFSEVMFKTQQEAMDFCSQRFQPVQKESER